MTTRAAASARRESLLAIPATHGTRGATASQLAAETGRPERQVRTDLYALSESTWRRRYYDGAWLWRWGVATPDPIASGRP